MKKMIFMICMCLCVCANSVFAQEQKKISLWPFYTQKDDEINVLWPFYAQDKSGYKIRPFFNRYEEEGLTEILWPLGSFDNLNDKYRFFPFFWGEDEFKLWPIFSWKPSKTSFLYLFEWGPGFFDFFPLLSYKKNHHFLFYPFGGKGEDYAFWKDEFVTILPPIYSQMKAEKSTRTNILWPLLSFSKGEKKGFRLFPLYESKTMGKLKERNYLWFLFRSKQYNDKSSLLLFPFLYQLHTKMTQKLAVFPLFYKSENRKKEESAFFTLLGGKSKGKDKSFLNVLGPLYSYKTEKNKKTHYLLWPFMKFSKGDDFSEQRFFPFFQFEKDGGFQETSLLWPLYNSQKRKYNQSQRFFPLWFSQYYDDGELSHSYNIIFPIYWDIKEKVQKRFETKKFIFPFYYAKKTPTKKSYGVFWPLITWENTSDGVKKFQMMFNLIASSSNKEESRFSLLFSLFSSFKSSQKSEKQFFPFFHYENKKEKGNSFSFLWRLFRYENTKEKIKYHFFFIPFSRSK